MPSHKPQPKLCAYPPTQNKCATEAASPISYQTSQSSTTSEKEAKKGNKIVLQKKQIKYSRNKQSLDLKTEARDKAMNTYQQKLPTIQTVSFKIGSR